MTATFCLAADFSNHTRKEDSNGSQFFSRGVGTQTRRLVLTLVVLLFSVACQAKYFHVHRFSRVWIVTQLALETTDGWATARAAAPYWGHGQEYLFRYELNPIAAPFVRRGPGSTAIYFAGEAGVKLGTAYLLHRTGHHRLEKWWERVSAADSSVGVLSRVVPR